MSSVHGTGTAAGAVQSAAGGRSQGCLGGGPCAAQRQRPASLLVQRRGALVQQHQRVRLRGPRPGQVSCPSTTTSLVVRLSCTVLSLASSLVRFQRAAKRAARTGNGCFQNGRDDFLLAYTPNASSALGLRHRRYSALSVWQSRPCMTGRCENRFAVGTARTRTASCSTGTRRSSPRAGRSSRCVWGRPPAGRRPSPCTTTHCTRSAGRRTRCVCPPPALGSCCSVVVRLSTYSYALRMAAQLHSCTGGTRRPMREREREPDLAPTSLFHFCTLRLDVLLAARC